MLANSLDSSSWLILSKQCKMFPVAHSLQVLQEFIRHPPPPDWLSCPLAASYLFCGSPSPFLSQPPTSRETNTPHPSSETCAYSIYVCFGFCVCTCACFTAYMFLCVFAYVCAYWCLFIQNIAALALKPEVGVLFLEDHWQPLWHRHAPASCVFAINWKWWDPLWARGGRCLWWGRSI